MDLEETLRRNRQRLQSSKELVAQMRERELLTAEILRGNSQKRPDGD